MLSARVVRAAPDDMLAHNMRAEVLSGKSYGTWEVGLRSAAELKEAAKHFERTAALCPAPAMKAELAEQAARCRSEARAM